jgi:hypothetical protein
MLFSDCAFVEFGNSLLAGVVATELMRDFVLARVPAILLHSLTDDLF